MLGSYATGKIEDLEIQGINHSVMEDKEKIFGHKLRIVKSVHQKSKDGGSPNSDLEENIVSSDCIRLRQLKSQMNSRQDALVGMMSQ